MSFDTSGGQAQRTVQEAVPEVPLSRVSTLGRTGDMSPQVMPRFRDATDADEIGKLPPGIDDWGSSTTTRRPLPPDNNTIDPDAYMIMRGAGPDTRQFRQRRTTILGRGKA